MMVVAVCHIRYRCVLDLLCLPVLRVYESANTRHWMASEVIFSKELIELERDLENELSSLSTRPINTKLYQYSTLAYTFQQLQVALLMRNQANIRPRWNPTVKPCCNQTSCSKIRTCMGEQTLTLTLPFSKGGLNKGTLSCKLGLEELVNYK